MCLPHIVAKKPPVRSVGLYTCNNKSESEKPEECFQRTSKDVAYRVVQKSDTPVLILR